jgi:hypothetical protein
MSWSRKKDHHSSFAAHSGAGGMPRERIAKDGIFRMVRVATDDAARVGVAYTNRTLRALCLKGDG